MFVKERKLVKLINELLGEKDSKISEMSSSTFLQFWLMSLDDLIVSDKLFEKGLNYNVNKFRIDEKIFKSKIKEVTRYKSEQEVCKAYNNTINMTYSTLVSIIKVSVIKELLLSYLKIEEDTVSYDTENISVNNYLFWYCVIKIVNTLKYDTHPNLIKFKNPAQVLFMSEADIRQAFIEYFNYIVKKDKSHKTDKLRRTLLLLKERNVKSNQLIRYYNSLLKESFESQVSVSKSIKELSKLITNRIDDSSNKSIEMIDLLPPPIFEYDFYDKDNSENSLSKVSSGQFQKVGLMSSIVYHLKNLDSIQDTTDIYSYENVNLILDEIELYFHPEQQRLFVNDLLDLLKKNKFKQIKRINIMFITHSPFVLSDIPLQNVLRLRKGNPVEYNENIKNSFGANIHDLLADEFFLDKGFMGEFAKEKIGSVVDFLTVALLESKEKMNKEEEEKVKKIKSKESYVEYTNEICKLVIDTIGEPMLRYNIEELYQQFLLINDNKEDSVKKEIARLEAKIQELRRKGEYQK